MSIIVNLPTENELEELSQTLRGCQTLDRFADIDGKLSALIQRYVRTKRFDLLDQAVVMHEDFEEDSQDEAQDLVVQAVEYHMTHREIPADGQFPTQEATLMALPLRLTPNIRGSLSAKVHTLENMLDFEDIGVIAGTLAETLKGRDARILMARKVYSAREIEEMGFAGLDSLTSEMLGDYLEVRDEFENPDSTSECDVTAFSAGDETDNDATVTAAEVAGLAYLLFVYIDKPGYVPFSRHNLTEEATEASFALGEWVAETSSLIEQRLGECLDCCVDLYPAAFYDNYDSGGEFWRYSQLRNHAFTLLELSGTAVEDVAVSLHVEFDDARLNGQVLSDGYDFSTWQENDSFSVLVSFRGKGRAIGSASVAALPHQSPQEAMGLIADIFEATGISNITALSFD
jgi:hypothetical protein